MQSLSKDFLRIILNEIQLVPLQFALAYGKWRRKRRGKELNY